MSLRSASPHRPGDPGEAANGLVQRPGAPEDKSWTDGVTDTDDDDDDDGASEMAAAMASQASQASQASSSSEDSLPDIARDVNTFDEEMDDEMQFTPVTTADGLTPGPGLTGYPSWGFKDAPPLLQPQQQPAQHQQPPLPAPQARLGAIVTSQLAHDHRSDTPLRTLVGRPQRPSAPARTPSHTYAPARGPPSYANLQSTQTRASPAVRSRRDPNAQYRAQEKAYVQRIRQEPNDYFPPETYTPSLAYSTGSEAGDESPSSETLFDSRSYDQGGPLYYGNDEMQPSLEELKIPANRERLEWHSMLASVLTGDVVKQEKKRLTGTLEQQGDNSMKAEVWLGVRSRVCGRTLPAQRRIVEDGRAGLDPVIESIINFQIKGEKEAGKPPEEQVQDIVTKIERCESLYPTRLALEAAKPRAASDAYRASSDAVIAWHSTTEHINTELGVLQRWVGNPQLDLAKKGDRSSIPGGLSDDTSFLDRILKEDGLKSLQGNHSMLLGLGQVIEKAKQTLIQNAEAFALRHLPPYIEELLTLINFPSRLVQEVITIRLSYTSKMKDPAQQSSLMIEQMISHFRILLRLAVQIKNEYTVIAQPQPGWELPPCIDEDFDRHVLDALKFYFQMLNWKLSGNKNTFKEAEILEQEWEFSNEIGRCLDGGDVEVAEQFR